MPRPDPAGRGHRRPRGKYAQELDRESAREVLAARLDQATDAGEPATDTPTAADPAGTAPADAPLHPTRPA